FVERVPPGPPLFPYTTLFRSRGDLLLLVGFDEPGRAAGRVGIAAGWRERPVALPGGRQDEECEPDQHQGGQSAAVRRPSERRYRTHVVSGVYNLVSLNERRRSASRRVPSNVVSSDHGKIGMLCWSVSALQPPSRSSRGWT